MLYSASQKVSELRYRINGSEAVNIYQNDTALTEQLINDVIQLFSDADDTYLILLTPKTIADIKAGSHMELIFKEPINVKTQIGPTPLQINKILIGLKGARFGYDGNNGNCSIIYGNPDYDEFNIVITTNPHITESELIKKLDSLFIGPSAPKTKWQQPPPSSNCFSTDHKRRQWKPPRTNQNKNRSRQPPVSI